MKGHSALAAPVREVCGKGMLRWLSRCLFWLRRFNISAGAWRPRFLVRPFVQAPAVRLAEVCHLAFSHHYCPPSTRDIVVALCA